MAGKSTSDIVFAGQRLRRKVLAALALASIVPLLVLAYVTQTFVVPHLHPGGSADFLGLQMLPLFTVVAIVAGGYVIWDIGGTGARLCEVLTDDGNMVTLKARRDEVGTLMSTVAK